VIGGKNNQSHEPFDDGDKYLQRYIPSNGERGKRGRGGSCGSKGSNFPDTKQQLGPPGGTCPLIPD